MILRASICAATEAAPRMPWTAGSAFEARDQRKQLRLAGGVRQTVVRTSAMPASATRFALSAHIDLARRIVPGQHDGKSRHQGVILRQTTDLGRNARAQTSRDWPCRRLSCAVMATSPSAPSTS